MATAKKTSSKKGASKAASKSADPVKLVAVWEQDPSTGLTPDGGGIVQVPVPVLNTMTFPTQIINPKPAPPPKVYPAGSSQFRYYTAASALSRASRFWGKMIPSQKWQRDVGSKLKVALDEGEDLNAFYDRNTLSFFHGAAGGRTIFSCESPDVVCHEHGHAVLDALKPQLWDAASHEAAAFHESFGDMGAILSALQLPSLRKDVLAETGGALFKSSKLSRVAEQLGWAIRQGSPQHVDPDCLRNAVNAFFYRDPQTLPASGPASSLTSQAHSFSRVFTGAFFEALAGMFRSRARQDEASLLQASADMGKILVAAIRQARVVPNFFSEVGANMIQQAEILFARSGYGPAIRSAFVRRGILSLTSVTSIRSESSRGFAAAAGTSLDGPLPQLNLSFAEYGLGIDTIVVNAPEQPRRANVRAAALSMGSLEIPSPQTAAKSFVEGLLVRGRLKVTGGDTNMRGMAPVVTRVNAATTHETFTHELRQEGGAFVLRRLRVDCCFHP